MGKKEIERLMGEALKHRYQGNYEKALERYQVIWDILMDRESPKEKWVLEKAGEVMHQIGVTFQNMGEFLAALLQLKQAKCFRRDNSDIIGYAFSSFQVAMCRLARGNLVEEVLPDFEIAKRAIEKAIPELRKEQDYKRVGDMGQNLAYIEQIKGEAGEAIDLYWNVFRIRDEQGDERGKGLTYARIAECYIQEGKRSQERGDIDGAARNFYEARQNAYAALEIFESIPDKSRIKQIRELLSEIAIVDRRII